MRLAQAVGSQFDTTVVAAFEAILATADESYRCGTSSLFDFFGDGGVATAPVDLAAMNVA
jgi:hypothetical protein